jgi:hypothetical protein
MDSLKDLSETASKTAISAKNFSNARLKRIPFGGRKNGALSAPHICLCLRSVGGKHHAVAWRFPPGKLSPLNVRPFGLADDAERVIAFQRVLGLLFCLEGCIHKVVNSWFRVRHQSASVAALQPPHCNIDMAANIIQTNDALQLDMGY